MSEGVKVRALIVDDEPAARLAIRNLLKAHPDVEVIRECGNGYEALDAVSELDPDLMFLDEVMPEIDGFAVLARLDKASRPLVVFVTAHEQFALRAFEVEPVDYLLKFPDQERFDEALRRVRDRLAARRAGRDAEAQPRSSYREAIYLHDTGGHIVVVHTDEIEWIEAEEHYVKIHGARKFPLLREKISTLEAGLDPRVFVPVHRSYVVRFKLITDINYDSKHKSWVVLRDGTQVPLSRTGYEKLLALRGKSS
jgi:two-component system LytT family response regulator